jgi:hypothetical protein
MTISEREMDVSKAGLVLLMHRYLGGRFSLRQIGIAFETLRAKSWLQAA